MSTVQLDVRSPEALKEALRDSRAGIVLVYNPAGGEQISLIQRQGSVAYYCDLNQRPPTSVVIETANLLGIPLENINAIQRNADLAEGAVPTMGRLTLEEGLLKISSQTMTKDSSDRMAPPGALFRVLSTLFGKKIRPETPDAEPVKINRLKS